MVVSVVLRSGRPVVLHRSSKVSTENVLRPRTRLRLIFVLLGLEYALSALEFALQMPLGEILVSSGLDRRFLLWQRLCLGVYDPVFDYASSPFLSAECRRLSKHALFLYHFSTDVVHWSVHLGYTPSQCIAQAALKLLDDSSRSEKASNKAQSVLSKSPVR
ncbi:uncharacterized protein DEA37_0002738 [Paragonimus westermani]|uniref:Uncharacterized protein n=1 Tax=Paragonimus westermani TaxID=34504 RepID=A0A5J4NC50_9TREM|nr:uncharacterized protein DEA37_0002738 [Paragonimus westermani]